jgi:uncharacterized protein YciI
VGFARAQGSQEGVGMLFMIAGYLKPGAESDLINFRDQFNEHLSHPFRTLVAAGVLRDAGGNRKAYLGFIEAQSFGEATEFLHQSPYYEAGLYDRTEVLQYWIEVGQVG